MNSGKIILGVLAGAATGTILGLLFAPEKGKNLRKKIARKSAKTASDMKDKFEDLMDDVVDKFEEGKEEIAEKFRKEAHKASEFNKEGKK